MEVRRPYDIDRLTDVALGVFAERGYDGASMDDVARAAGVTKAALYHHVAGKEALLERGLNRALDALFAVLDEPEARLGSALPRLRHIVRRAAALTTELKPELTVLFHVKASSEVTSAALDRRRDFDHHVAGLIAKAQAAGELRGDLDGGLAARLIFGMSNSIAEWYRPEGGLSATAIADAVEALAFGGLRGGEGR